jgi:hypothetical protein
MEKIDKGKRGIDEENQVVVEPNISTKKADRRGSKSKKKPLGSSDLVQHGNISDFFQAVPPNQAPKETTKTRSISSYFQNDTPPALETKGEVNIDCDFTATKLPGCIVTGKLTCFKSMIGFDDGKGGTQYGLPNIKSMVGFDDIRGSTLENTPPISPEHRKRVVELLKTTEFEKIFKRDKELIERGIVSGTFRPDQFGFENDYPFAKELGFTDQDIRFYIEGFYSKVLGKMREGMKSKPVLSKLDDGTLMIKEIR